MLGKSGSKFRHGGGGFKNGQKNSDVFYGRPLGGGAEAYVHNGLESFLKLHPYSYFFLFMNQNQQLLKKRRHTI